MSRSIVLLAFVVAACSEPVVIEGNNAVIQADAPVAAPSNEAVSAPPAPQPQASAPADDEVPMDGIGYVQDDPMPSLCWQDYCPCDPPQGGADANICRQLRAGMHIDDEMMAAAAGLRDARRQIEDFEAEHGPF